MTEPCHSPSPTTTRLLNVNLYFSSYPVRLREPMLRPAFVYRVMIALSLFAFSVAVGCGGSSKPEATSGDELSRYLDAHPELKEQQAEVAPSDPRKK